ncbi:ABC transporter ATP-binding protein [Nocardioides sp. Root190]|uniref:ABC transporter ATP-binding protein n=1 Tax=Nocardioides sp. Root190 TaxID=1736488 RepID=UPI000700EB91|nr:ABC transporter ATP-binding protein [Nocardioides sp. Root190]KRB80415.1 ABC transporter ATP-binding protein [Nocardioides sp. Root190]
MTNDTLRIDGLHVGYRGARVLHDISIAIPPGTVTALLGPNGAGKTTLLRAAAGLLRPTAGSLRLAGADVTRWSAARRARHGLCLIPEGRGVFGALTVRENLRMMLPARAPRSRIDEVLDVFPDLRSRTGQAAGSMSGGQQQMLALARAWLTGPKIVLLDEVSMGLAPLVVDEIFVALDALRSTGVSLLLVEQYVDRALAMADTVHLLDRGRITFGGPAAEIDRDGLLASYLGAPTH